MTQRREARVEGILAAAWELAHTHGIAGVSLHGLAREVGMRQPSLYGYFDSKHALFDAMFADGNRRLIERIDALELPREPRAALKAFMHMFVDFALEDEARYTLLFQRLIPGFEPTPETYALAETVLARVVARLRAAGIERDGDIDCFVAMVAGLIEAQITNDPGGDRWVKHLDRLTDMHLDEVKRRKKNT